MIVSWNFEKRLSTEEKLKLYRYLSTTVYQLISKAKLLDNINRQSASESSTQDTEAEMWLMDLAPNI